MLSSVQRPALSEVDEQLVIEGDPEPVEPPAPSGKHETQQLFSAPQTIRGQMAL